MKRKEDHRDARGNLHKKLQKLFTHIEALRWFFLVNSTKQNIITPFG